MAQRRLERQAVDPSFRYGRPGGLVEKVRARILAGTAAGRTPSQIARALTDEGVPTARGGETWWPASVWWIANASRGPA